MATAFGAGLLQLYQKALFSISFLMLQSSPNVEVGLYCMVELNLPAAETLPQLRNASQESRHPLP